MWAKYFFIFLLLSATALSALATPRSFPANVKRGSITGSTFPEIIIDGQVQRLSPGAKIISIQNMILMPSTLTNKLYNVNYTVDNQGYINMVWILTNEELANSPQ